MRKFNRTQLARYFSYGTLILAGMVWIYASRLPSNPSSIQLITAPHAGFSAPEITLTDLSGKEFSLSEFKGQPVIINFWATWCPPCRAEMPAMQRAYADYVDRGLLILAVNSTIQDDLIDVQGFVDNNQLTIPILLDFQGSAERDYQVSSLPSTFFIDKGGVIREVVIGGPMSEALLRSRIEKLMKDMD